MARRSRVGALYLFTALWVLALSCGAASSSSSSSSTTTSSSSSPLIVAAAALDFEEVAAITEARHGEERPPLIDFIDAMAAACGRNPGRKRSKRVAKIINLLANGRYTNDDGERDRVALALEAAGSASLVSVEEISSKKKTESDEKHLTARAMVDGVEHGATPLHICAAGGHSRAVKAIVSTVRKVQRWRRKKMRQSLGTSKAYQHALAKRNAMRVVMKEEKNTLSEAKRRFKERSEEIGAMKMEAATLEEDEDADEGEEDNNDEAPVSAGEEESEGDALGGQLEADRETVVLPQFLGDAAVHFAEVEKAKLLDDIAAAQKIVAAATSALTKASDALTAARLTAQAEWARRPQHLRLIEWRTAEGHTALSMALAHLDHKMAKALLKIGGADVDSRDWDGWTALMKVAYLAPLSGGEKIADAMNFIEVLAASAADGTLRAPIDVSFDATRTVDDDDDGDEEDEDREHRSIAEGKTPRELAREACSVLLIDESTGRLRSDSGDEQEMCRNIDDVLKFFEILGPANSIKKMGDEQQQQKDDDPDGGEEEREKTEVEKAAEEKIVKCFEANMKGEAVEGCDDDAIAVLTKVAMSVSNL